MNQIQNKNRTSFAGAWTNYGFHEDGCTSGLLAAASIGAACPFTIALNGGYITNRETLPVPAYLTDKVERYIHAPPKYATNAPVISSSISPHSLLIVFVSILALFWAVV